MTLPISTILPVNSEQITQGGAELEKYMRDLVFSLQRQYEEVAQAINGDIRANTDPGSRNYTPTASGASTAGAGTYQSQVGWVLRQGLMVDCWFDMQWSAHTGTGVLEIDLPYECTDSSGLPFLAIISASNITFTGYITGSITPGSRKMLIQDNRSGANIANITMPSVANIKGHVRYVGVELERS